MICKGFDFSETYIIIFSTFCFQGSLHQGKYKISNWCKITLHIQVLILLQFFYYYYFSGDRPSFGSRRGGGGRGGFSGGRGSLKGKQPGERLRKPRWDMSKLMPFQKNFYKEHPNVQRRSMVSFLLTDEFRAECMFTEIIINLI